MSLCSIQTRTVCVNIGNLLGNKKIVQKEERNYRDMTIRILFWGMGILLVLGLMGACAGDDPTRPSEDVDILLTVEFNNYIFPRDGSPREGFVFVSDQDGRVLDCAPWTSNSKVILKNAEVHPDKVVFTLFENHQSGPDFSTELAVPVGATRIFSTQQIPIHGCSTCISLQNRPDASRFLGAANRFTCLSQFGIPSSIDMPVVGDSTDMYFMAVPEVGTPVGGWLRGVRSGDRDTLDFESPEDFSPLNAIRINTPSGGIWKRCRAITNIGTDPLGGTIMVDNISLNPANTDTLVLYLPPLDSSDMVFEFYQEFSGQYGTYFWQEVEGWVPESFSNLEGDLTLVAALPDSVVVETSFPWDRFSAWWTQDRENPGSWRIEGPVLTESQGLPEIPQEIATEVPTYQREGYLIRAFEVYQETSEGMTRSQGKRFQVGAKSCEGEIMRPGYNAQR